MFLKTTIYKYILILNQVQCISVICIESVVCNHIANLGLRWVVQHSVFGQSIVASRQYLTPPIYFPPPPPPQTTYQHPVTTFQYWYNPHSLKTLNILNLFCFIYLYELIYHLSLSFRFLKILVLYDWQTFLIFLLNNFHPVISIHCAPSVFPRHTLHHSNSTS